MKIIIIKKFQFKIWNKNSKWDIHNVSTPKIFQIMIHAETEEMRYLELASLNISNSHKNWNSEFSSLYNISGTFRSTIYRMEISMTNINAFCIHLLHIFTSCIIRWIHYFKKVYMSFSHAVKGIYANVNIYE